MQENGKQNNKEIHPPGFDYNLQESFENDYLESLNLLRESFFGNKFHPAELNNFFHGLQWLTDQNNFNTFKNAKDGDDSLPKPARDFQQSLKLFIELKYKISQRQDNQIFDQLLNVRAAYSSRNNKEKLIRDLENSSYDTWRKLHDSEAYKTPDALCAEMFRSYWGNLLVRAAIIKSGGNHQVVEPSGSL